MLPICNETSPLKLRSRPYIHNQVHSESYRLPSGGRVAAPVLSREAGSGLDNSDEVVGREYQWAHEFHQTCHRASTELCRVITQTFDISKKSHASRGPGAATFLGNAPQRSRIDRSKLMARRHALGRRQAAPHWPSYRRGTRSRNCRSARRIRVRSGDGGRSKSSSCNGVRRDG